MSRRLTILRGRLSEVVTETVLDRVVHLLVPLKLRTVPLHWATVPSTMLGLGLATLPLVP